MKNLNSTKQIYLVDDDDDDRETFIDAVSEVNDSIIITEAVNGLQLMEILNLPPNHIPDIIFLDMNMPLKNGFECLEEIRNLKNGLNLLNVIMLSTSNNPSSIETAMKLGASHYAIKPNSFGALKTLIDKALNIDWTISNRSFLLS